MRRTKDHIGRLRIRAAKILGANFPEWDVRPEDIMPASGSYRTDIRHDVYRWELFIRHKLGCSTVVGCWDTLTQFVREAAKRGCHLSNGEIHAGPPLRDQAKRVGPRAAATAGGLANEGETTMANKLTCDLCGENRAVVRITASLIELATVIDDKLICKDCLPAFIDAGLEFGRLPTEQPPSPG